MLSLRQDLCVGIRRRLCIDVSIGGNNISGVFLFLHLWIYHLWLYVLVNAFDYKLDLFGWERVVHLSLPSNCSFEQNLSRKRQI